MSRDAAVDTQVRNVVDGLVNHTQGVIPRERLTEIVDRLYDDMAARSTVTTFLPVLVGRAALKSAQAELPAAQAALQQRPEVLIVCQENAGRSQAAAALFRHYAPGLLFVESAGLAPADGVLPDVVAGLAAHGVHLIDETKPVTPEMLDRAQHIIVIGDARVKGQRWDVPQIDTASAAEIAEVLGDLDVRVRDALHEWFPDLDLGEPVMSGVSDPV